MRRLTGSGPTGRPWAFSGPPPRPRGGRNSYGLPGAGGVPTTGRRAPPAWRRPRSPKLPARGTRPPHGLAKTRYRRGGRGGAAPGAKLRPPPADRPTRHSHHWGPGRMPRVQGTQRRFRSTSTPAPRTGREIEGGACGPDVVAPALDGRLKMPSPGAADHHQAGLQASPEAHTPDWVSSRRRRGPQSGPVSDNQARWGQSGHHQHQVLGPGGGRGHGSSGPGQELDAEHLQRGRDGELLNPRGPADSVLSETTPGSSMEPPVAA